MYLSQIAAHDRHNAGDTVLTDATRKVFELNGSHYWQLTDIYHPRPEEFVELLNTQVDALIIGGGGLLNPVNVISNRVSGWFCSLTVDEIKKINIPIIVFAVGNSRFRGGPDFNIKFRPHIQEVVRKSIFFGLRNHGSLRSLIPYLESDVLTRKLTYQPCPSTLIKYLYPEYEKPKEKILALNIALDSAGYRFGDKAEEILTAVARAMKWATKHGWQVKVAHHAPFDKACCDWLEEERVDYQFVRLCGYPPKTVLDFYSTVSLAVAMRSHGQMIPFGLGNPAISLISHNKLKYFLEDTNHSEWGIEVKEDNLEYKLIKKIEYMTDNETVREQIAKEQARLWDITLENLKWIKLR